MKSRFINAVKKLTIKQQFILLIVITGVPLLAFNAYGNYKAEEILKRDVTEAYVELNKQNFALLNRDIENVHKITATIIQHPLVQSLLPSGQETIMERVKKYERVEKLLNSYSQNITSGENVNYSLYVYDPDDDFYFAPYYPDLKRAGVYFFSDKEKPEWFDEAVNQKGNGYLRLVNELSPQTKVDQSLTYMRAVNNIYEGNRTEAGRTIGVLVVTKMDDKIGESLKTVSLPDGKIYLTNWNNVVMAATTPEVGVSLHLPVKEPAHTQLEGVQDVITSDFIYVVNFTRTLQQKLVYEIPVKSLLQQQNEMKHVIQLLSLIYAVLVIILMFYFWRSLMRPLHKLSFFMRHYEPGKNVPKTPVRTRHDEVSLLITSTYDMARRLNGLIQYKYQMEIKQKESELQLLYQQINPHLLYNTLESIYWKSTLEGNKESAEMIKELSKLMKISLSRGRELITLAEELEHATAYMKLQQHRHDYQFQVHWDIDEQLLNESIPKVTLQPLIENSIMHGIKSMGEDGEITIRAQAKGYQMQISIEDNGFKEVDIEGIHQSIILDHSETSTGYGVRNIHRRIQLHFGKDFGLSYHHREGGGTIAMITLPRSEVLLPKDSEQQRGTKHD